MRKTTSWIRSGLFAVLAGSAAWLMSAPANAALVASDGFEGYSGELNGESGGTDWTLDWSGIPGVVVGTDTLSYAGGSVLVNGGANSVRVEGVTNDSAASRSFDAQTGTVYFSFLFSHASSDGNNDFIHFALNDDASITNSGSIGLLSTTTARIGTRIGGTNGGTTESSSTDAVLGETYFLVGKMSKVDSSATYNRMELFINPTSDVEPGTADATDDANSGVNAIDFFSLRTVNIGGDDLILFDELRIGTTFADVVPTVVPEPAGVWLAGLCGLGAGWFVRRRKRRTAGWAVR